ncbi:hypothetical protein QCA50_004451 [Cerrena zonata]|uniref:HSF-type DNA-binding domain-containing protein n=1 Tax=Cerrena zonata TaxID=2478898 RepID=A0AAW0GJI6_9APHY
MEHSGLSASMAQNISLSSLLRNASLQNTLATSPTSTDLSGLSANLSNLVSNTNTVFRYPQSLHPYPSPTLSDSQLPISLQSWQTNPMVQQQASACNEMPSMPRGIDLRHPSSSQPQREDRRRSVSPPHHRQSKSDDSPHEDEESQSTTSEFVKKLYKMLEDSSYSNVVSWTPRGDAFVVKDMNEFSLTILPRTFKHSNFASFVRQLNKYDFHKIKNSDDDPFGEHSWTFRHPHFRQNRKESLEKIKRKGPVARKSTSSSGHRVSDSPTPHSTATIEALQATIETMARTQEEMALHIRHLETNYRNVLNEMVDFQRNQARQDGLLQNLIQIVLQPENNDLAGATLSS